MAASRLRFRAFQVNLAALSLVRATAWLLLAVVIHAAAAICFSAPPAAAAPTQSSVLSEHSDSVSKAVAKKSATAAPSRRLGKAILAHGIARLECAECELVLGQMTWHDRHGSALLRVPLARGPPVQPAL